MSMLASSREECAQQKVGAKDNVSVWVMLDSCVLLPVLILATVHVASVLVIRQGSPAMKSRFLVRPVLYQGMLCAGEVICSKRGRWWG